MKINEHINALDVIIPVSIELDWPTKASITADIREQHKRYGFCRFALAAPSGGWRSIGYPPREHYIDRAKLFAKVRDELIADGIECGWWITATLKSGRSEQFTPMVDEKGDASYMANCPMDPAFRKSFSENVALFASIAHPAFILTEDDFSVLAGSSQYGCFCKHHLAEFAKRTGKAYTREELIAIFGEKNEESYSLLRQWRALAKDSMVTIAQEIRRAVDEKTPEIPIGYMQAGCADMEGDCTREVCRALAGPNHVPFSRFHGTAYCGGDSKDIPKILFSALYTKQHNPDILAYHESDTFPHTRFFMSGAFMRAMMSVVYSAGFDGSTFQTQQLLDDPNEEVIYGKMFREERNRFDALHKAAKVCRMRGVELSYDPFWNTVDHYGSWKPLWARPIGLFGIPYTTTREKVACWDARQARHYDHATVMEYLSKGLILDGAAAKELCARGYGKYLGVDVGEVVTKGALSYDLAAREVICEGFMPGLKGRHMPSPHMYAIGNNGNLLRLTVTDANCEVLSELVSFEKEHISPAMTRYENALGGKIVVMGSTLFDEKKQRTNLSQSLYNYRRQKILQHLVQWCGGDYATVENEANVFVVMNEAIDPPKAGFRSMLTLVNLGDDPLDRISVAFPSMSDSLSEIYYLAKNGEWKKQRFTKTQNGFSITKKLSFGEPVCLILV